MGAVYQARDRETGETVALKVLLPEIAARADLMERFRAEVRLAVNGVDPRARKRVKAGSRLLSHDGH
jgi:serine/threonine-protein kinase